MLGLIYRSLRAFMMTVAMFYYLQPSRKKPEKGVITHVASSMEDEVQLDPV